MVGGIFVCMGYAVKIGTHAVDAVTGACSQICIHLSDSLFDLVLNMIYDYASTNVRSNAVRAIHQLVDGPFTPIVQAPQAFLVEQVQTRNVMSIST